MKAVLPKMDRITIMEHHGTPRTVADVGSMELPWSSYMGSMEFTVISSAHPHLSEMHEIHRSNEVLMWPEVVMSTLLSGIQESQSKFHQFAVSGR